MTVYKGVLWVVVVSYGKYRATQVVLPPVCVRKNEKMCKKLRCQNTAGKMKRGTGRGDARVKVEKW